MAEKISVPEPDSEINKLVYVRRDDGSYGGWRTELLEEEITGKIEAKFLLCNCCRGVLRDACLFEKYDNQELRCSVCIPTDVNRQKVQLNRETVNDKQVYCPLKKKGCGWTSELSELLHHLEECELFPVPCPLGCRDEHLEVSRVERRGVETHRTFCPMRTVNCEYCSNSVKACDMNGHLEVCEEFPIPCPNKCSEEFRMKRKDKSIHLNQECPLQETECPYSQYGCGVKVKRINLEHHEKEDMHKHMKLTVNMVNNVQSKVVTLEKENEKFTTKIVELEKINEELKNNDLKYPLLISIISSLGLKGFLQWKINKVRNILSEKEKSYIYSDPFYVGLYKFQGKFEWDQIESYVGLFLHIMEGEFDDTLKWPIRYKYSMVLVNQLNAKHSHEMNDEITEEDLKKFPQCLNKPSTKRNDGLGGEKFISHSVLLQKKYYNGDEITLKISVELLQNP